MILWKWCTFDELTNQELYDILALREAVFAIEQNILYQDMDYQDQKCIHLLGIQDDKIVSYLRLSPQNTKYPDAVSFGRVLTAKSARGQGLAKEAMAQVIQYLEKQANTLPVLISAQLYLKNFYSLFGLEPIGEEFLVDTIPHIKMKGTLQIPRSSI